MGTAAEISNNDLDGIVADVERERRSALLAVTPAVVSLVLVALALLIESFGRDVVWLVLAHRDEAVREAIARSDLV